jgi:predicted PurR-regulated permease PerM
MGVVTYIGLSIIGVPYAALFAALSFVLDFVPYFGSTIAGIIEAIVATMTGGIGLGITVAIFVLIVQQIEGNIVAPKVQGDATGLHPVTVMFALLACNRIWGPMGMLISTPVAAVVKIVVREMYNYLIDGEEPTVNQVVARHEQEEHILEEKLAAGEK